MLISVIIPTWRRHKYLPGVLACLDRQTLDARQFEVIVVSDGPDDALPGLVSSQNFRRINPRVIYLPENAGPAAARNEGIEAALAHYLAFTDDDCLPEPEWLQGFLKAIETFPDRVFAGRLTVPVSSCPTDFEQNTKGLERAEFITANCCIPASAVKKIGNFDTRFRLAWREDSDLQFRLLDAGYVITRVDLASVIHPVRKARWGVSLKEQKKSLYDALLFKKHRFLFKERISTHGPYDYYVMCACLPFIVLFRTPWSVWLGICLWTVFYFRFLTRRISGTCKTPGHVMEMLVTSIFIPFLSVFWRAYGGVKYRVWFI